MARCVLVIREVDDEGSKHKSVQGGCAIDITCWGEETKKGFGIGTAQDRQVLELYEACREMQRELF